jgi:putative ABC transport system substrate-binding protein
MWYLDFQYGLRSFGGNMRRRDVLALIGGTAAAWPLAARAQQAKMPVIGLLSSASLEVGGRLAGFRKGLSEAGYREGQNLAIEYRWAVGEEDRLPALAADLVRRQVALIAALANGESVRAAQAATTTIPIVFELPVDPVAAGIVPSLNRPGGNVTGIANFTEELGPKRLELLHEMVPAARSMALLINTDTPPQNLQDAARSRGLELNILRVTREDEFEAAFESVRRLRAGAMMIETGRLLNTRVEQLAALAARHAIPVSHTLRDFPSAGGLMSYGADVPDQYRLGGIYAGRILSGTKPADLPVQQPTKLKLTINLKAAKAMGLTVPLTLLVAADEVIEQ